MRTSLSEIHLNSMVSFLKRSDLNICVWCRPWPSGFGSGAHLFTPTPVCFCANRDLPWALSTAQAFSLAPPQPSLLKYVPSQPAVFWTGGLSWAFLHRGPGCDLDPELWLFPPFVLWSTCFAAWETEAWRQVPYTTQWQKSRKWGLPGFSFQIHCK